MTTNKTRLLDMPLNVGNDYLEILDALAHKHLTPQNSVEAAREAMLQDIASDRSLLGKIIGAVINDAIGNEICREAEDEARR